MARRPARFHPRVDRLDDRCLPSAGFTPAQLIQAYGLNSVAYTASNGHWVPGNAAGQMIALIEAYHDPNLASDLVTFDRTYKLAPANLQQVNLSGSPTNSDDGWSEEEVMDVEWAHALAPGATILVVEANSANIPDLLAAISYARSQPSVTVVSMSWGTNEFASETSYDNDFTTPAGHAGITFVAATGDNGAGSGTEWPAASPNVLAVGGTTLQIGSSGNYLGESAWSGGGGGYSRFEVEPAYQASVQSSGRRSVPDVSFDADPSSGVSAYYTAPSSGLSSWVVVGGTSLGAPSWAAVIAVTDQGLAPSGHASLDGATQTLPDLYKISAKTFHDITSGSNSYAAQPGYDLATGLGSPNVPTLVHNLITGTFQAGTGSGGSQSSGGQTGAGQTGAGQGSPHHPWWWSRRQQLIAGRRHDLHSG
jgi:subtilase family serine protease